MRVHQASSGSEFVKFVKFKWCEGTKVLCFVSGEFVVILILHLANIPLHVEG